MTAELTPDDLVKMRERHQRFPSEEVAKIIDDAFRDFPNARPLNKFTCAGDNEYWPCDAVRLLDEVERLRRPQSERDQMARLQTEWEQHVIAGFERAMDIRDNPKPYAVQQSTTTRVIPQSEAPSVSEGGGD